MKCTQCQADIPDDSIFCPSCGQKAHQPDHSAFSGMKKCAACQAPLDPDAKFCESCGTPVEKPAKTCPGCQSVLSENAVFCRQCGYRLTGDSQQTAAAGQQMWQAPVQPVAAPVQPTVPAGWPPQQTAPYHAPQSYQPYASQQSAYTSDQTAGTANPPKKKKGWLIALIIVLVLALAGTATALLAGKQIKRLLMGSEATYLSIEAQALKTQADDLVKNLAKISNISSTGSQGGTDLQIKLALEAETLGIDPVLATIIENLTIHTTYLYDHTGPEEKSFTAIDLLSQDEQLMTIEIFREPDRMILGLPGILNQYVVTNNTELGSLLESDSDVSLDQSLGILSDMMQMDLDIDHDALQVTLYKAIDIVLEHIDSVTFDKKQTLEAGDLSAAYDRYTVTLNSENLRLMMLDILNLVRSDHDVYGLVNGFVQLSAIDPNNVDSVSTVSFSDYQEAIDSAIQNLEDAADEEPFTIIQQLYVDKNDDVAGRDIKIQDENGDTTTWIKFLNPVNDNQEAWLISFVDDTQDIVFSSQYSVRDEKKTGDATLVVDQETVLSATFSEFSLQASDDQTFPLGDVSLSILVSPDSGEPLKLDYQGWEDSDRLWMSLTLPQYGALEVGYQELADSDSRIPALDDTNLVSLEDQDALATLFDENAMEKVMGILEKLGLSDYMNSYN
ncbi:MAG: hypothetical protein GX173_04885, partial [Ruminococcaceae bacterium]|nr:hypothetical protein [Oscillospiraceae bacterium]